MKVTRYHMQVALAHVTGLVNCMLLFWFRRHFGPSSRDGGQVCFIDVLQEQPRPKLS